MEDILVWESDRKVKCKNLVILKVDNGSVQEEISFFEIWLFTLVYNFLIDNPIILDRFEYRSTSTKHQAD